jgi:hypothetical protein
MSTSIGDEVKAVRKLHPSWSFEQSWNHVMALKPELEASSAESNRVAAKLAPQKEQEARSKFEHVEAIARQLMQRNRKLTLGAALEITRTCLPGVQAGIKDLLRQSVKAEEPKTYLVESIETGRQLDFGEYS